MPACKLPAGCQWLRLAQLGQPVAQIGVSGVATRTPARCDETPNRGDQISVQLDLARDEKQGTYAVAEMLASRSVGSCRLRVERDHSRQPTQPEAKELQAEEGGEPHHLLPIVPA